jgi:hypothetical protein
VHTVAGDPHDRDDLLDSRRFGRIPQTFVARRMTGVKPGIVAGDRRRPAASRTGDPVTRSTPGYDGKRSLSPPVIAPQAIGAIWRLPLGPRSESAGRYDRTPPPLLSRMELGSAGSTAAFPRMQERHRLTSRPGGRLHVVRSDSRLAGHRAGTNEVVVPPIG